MTLESISKATFRHDKVSKTSSKSSVNNSLEQINEANTKSNSTMHTNNTTKTETIPLGTVSPRAHGKSTKTETVDIGVDLKPTQGEPTTGGSHVEYKYVEAKKLVEIGDGELKDSNKDKNMEHGNKYQRYMDLNDPSNDAWCAAFVSWCANEAGISEKVIPHKIAVNDFYDYFVNEGHGTWHPADSGYKPH